jgi:hypothetical protein
VCTTLLLLLLLWRRASTAAELLLLLLLEDGVTFRPLLLVPFAQHRSLLLASATHNPQQALWFCW